MDSLPHRLCLAPMMDRTDRHFRYLLRIISPNTWLYTEMITARALLHGNAPAMLEFDFSEHPLAVQLGGSEPEALGRAASLAAEAGYDEINLNCGCPSDRVQSGCFGAALMLDAPRVADCVAAMREASALPVTVKTRIGVDDSDSYEFLSAFVGRVVAAGARTLFVHARKAWLKGLSPKQNREIPPLDYGRVHRLKAEYAGLEIVVNGGLVSVADAQEQLRSVDGVMLGRAAYADPLLLGAIDSALYGGEPRELGEVLAAYLRHIETELERGTPLRRMTRHLMGLMAGRPGARRWRRQIASLGDGPASLSRLRDEVAGIDVQVAA